MKKITLLFTGMIAASFAFSQTIPNAGFETWVNNTESGSTYSIPQHWTTNDQLQTAFDGTYVGTAVTKTTSMYTGSFAVLMQTCISSGDTVPGGIYACDSLSQFVSSIFGGPKALGWPYTTRSASLKGWYKYTKVGGDTGTVFVCLTKWNAGTQTHDTVGQGQVLFSSNVSTYTQFTINLNYTLGMNPDTAFIAAFIAGPNGGKTHVGTMFYLDALSFNGTVPVGINEIASENKFVSIFPNPVTTKATIQIDAKIQLNRSALKVYDLLGNEVRSFQNLNSNTITFEKNELPGGIYFYTLTNDGQKIANGKFVIE